MQDYLIQTSKTKQIQIFHVIVHILIIVTLTKLTFLMKKTYYLDMFLSSITSAKR